MGAAYAGPLLGGVPNMSLFKSPTLFQALLSFRVSTWGPRAQCHFPPTAKEPENVSRSFHSPPLEGVSRSFHSLP